MKRKDDQPEIVIIGAGFSGICIGVKLQQELGHSRFTIFDENHDFGGTWLTHTYPGCASDVPGHLYSYSFELNPNWSRAYPPQPEILAYLKGVAHRHNLYAKAKFHHQIKTAKWNEGKARWQLVILDNHNGLTYRKECSILIGCVGAFRNPVVPKEFSNFKGTLIHTAKWNSEFQIDGKSVGVVGSGCSGVQIIPAIQPRVKRLVSFQRSQAWVTPVTTLNYPSAIKWIFSMFPLLMKAYRILLFLTFDLFCFAFGRKSWLREISKWSSKIYMKWQIPKNTQLRSKLLPDYEIGCRRVTPSRYYFKSLDSSKCEVETKAIVDIKDDRIITSDGKEYQIDVLILATGYRVQDFFWPMKLFGTNAEDILDKWINEGPSHYFGVATASTPNLFTVLGPNSANGHSSAIFTIECQSNWIIQVIGELMRRKSRVVVVKEEAESKFMKSLKLKLNDTVWATCSNQNWYFNKNHDIVALHPGSATTLWRKIRNPDFSALEFR